MHNLRKIAEQDLAALCPAFTIGSVAQHESPDLERLFPVKCNPRMSARARPFRGAWDAVLEGTSNV
jgi:hypothetical protein